jgi:hypothetical protein
MPDLTPGSTFAGHRIEGIAGRGGMGTVYRATHLALDHEVALKVISPELAGDEAFRERFRSETRIAVSLRHPNVVPIHHAGEEDELLFVTMDLIDGPDLRRLLITGGSMKPARAIGLIGQVASALDVAHSRGLVHRDIKPGNILVAPGGAGGEETEHAYLTDFGLAKRFDQATVSGGLTGTGAFVGTLDYVAPEQIRGDRVDARTDVYALGCVLYESMAGRPPFGDRDENVAKIYAHLQDEPPWLPGEGVEGLDEVIARALAKQPEDRFPSAGDLARAAKAAEGGTDARTVERSVARGAAAPETLAPGETAPAAAVPVEIPVGAPTEPPPPPTKPGGPPAGNGPSWGRLAALGAAVAAVVVAVVVLAGGGGGGGDGGSSSTTDASVNTTATGGKQPPDPKLFGDPITIAGFPVGLAIHDHDVSVATREGSGLVTIDKVERTQIGDPVTLGGEGEDVATTASFAWVTLPQDDAVAKVSLDGNTLLDTIPVGVEPRGITYSGGFLWVADFGSGEISKIDPSTDSTVDTTPLGNGAAPTDIAFGEGSLWVTDRAGGQVIRIDAGGGQQAFDVGANPKGVVVAGSDVWVANTDDGTVTRLGVTGGKSDTIKVGGEPRGVAAGFGYIWVANGGDTSSADPQGYVTAIDPNHPKGPPMSLDLPGSPEEVAMGPKRMWVTTGAGDGLVTVDPPGGVVD